MAGLFDRVTAYDTLFEAWCRVRANRGSAGGDGESVATFEATGVPGRLRQLSEEMRAGCYRPGPLRRLTVRKPDGGTRPLAIPCVRDRIAQTAAALALTPRLDPEMEDSSFAYRVGRSALRAVRRVEALRAAGYVWVVDGDIERYFERVPHDPLVGVLARYVDDGALLALVRLWLRAAMAGTPTPDHGLPQGSPLSPLLSNLYLDDVDEALDGHGVRLVRFADDFVILCRDRRRAEAALGLVGTMLEDRGLRLHPDKTRIVSFDQGFRFLGHLFLRSLVVRSPPGETDDAGSPPATVPPAEGPPSDAASPLTPAADAALALAAPDDEADEAEKERAGPDATPGDAGWRLDALTLYVFEPGRVLTVRNEAFAVEEAGRPVAVFPGRRLARIDVGPDVRVDPDAMALALETRVPIWFLTGGGTPLGLLEPPVPDRATLHLAQAALVRDPARRRDLAAALVTTRIHNQRSLLHRMNRRRKCAEIAPAIKALTRHCRSARRDGRLDMGGLRGVEGAAGAVFWAAYARLIDAPGWSLPKRTRRPPADAANAVLSFLAALLLREVGTAVRRRGLHPGFGVLHEGRDRYDALVFDLAEEFRTTLVEGLAAYLINNRMIDAADCGPPEPGAPPRIGPAARTVLIREVERTLARPLHSPATGHTVPWRRVIADQVDLFARAALAGADSGGAGEDGGAATAAVVYRPYRLDH